MWEMAFPSDHVGQVSDVWPRSQCVPFYGPSADEIV